MNAHTRQILRAVLFLAFMATADAWAYYMYRAGCMADLKGGTWGNHQLALETEMLAVAIGLAACALLGALLASATGYDAKRRTVWFLGGVLTGVVVIFAAGFYIETEGIRVCAPTHHKSPRQ